MRGSAWATTVRTGNSFTGNKRRRDDMRQFRFSADERLALSPDGVRLAASPAFDGVTCDRCRLCGRTRGCRYYAEAAAALMTITRYCRCTGVHRKDGCDIIWTEA
jgi:hypothetical protein